MSRRLALSELASFLGADLRGDPEYLLAGIATLADAEPEHLSFLANPKYAKHLPATRAGAVILHPDQAEQFTGNALLVDNPYLAYAQVASLFDQRPLLPAGVHPSATVADDAVLEEGVAIGPGVVIEAGCRIGAGTQVHANTVIGAGTQVGADCLLWANVTLYHGVRLGDRVIVHSAAVIGCDGFGNAPKPGGGWLKIPQLGGVTVGDDVEIGSSTCIDRGALADTVLENGVRLDNLVQIAHNCRIGENTAIAAGTGMAGSTQIGANCTFGGQCGIAGHITIADNCHFTGMAMVTHSITEPGVYSSGTGIAPSRQWRKSAVRFNQLDELAKQVKALEKQLQVLSAAADRKSGTEPGE